MSASVACSAKHILVVDDDASVRSSLKILLTIDRHEVTEAASGQDALYLFTGSPFDLVIIDYFMPDMLGDELAQNLRSLAPSQPILVVTAYREKLVETGNWANAIVAKPLSLDQLRDAMNRIFRQIPT